MSSPAILVFDIEPTSFQIVQKLFFNDSIHVFWASTLEPEQLNAVECSILLYAVRTNEDYEIPRVILCLKIFQTYTLARILM